MAAKKVIYGEDARARAIAPATASPPKVGVISSSIRRRIPARIRSKPSQLIPITPRP